MDISFERLIKPVVNSRRVILPLLNIGGGFFFDGYTERMKNVALIYDPAVLDHGPFAGHPERPARVRETFALLESSGTLDRLERLPGMAASRPELEMVHLPHYLDRVESLVALGGGMLDLRNTMVSPGSWDAATAAAGAAIEGVNAVLTGGCDSAFALVRPPGHHAPGDRAMGFCILNNVAAAAAHAVVTHEMKRVLIVDFDVHHGNGTQDIFYESEQVLYFSVHQSPAYPFTGAVEETGFGAGEGFTVNVPLPPGVGDDGFVQAFDEILRPVADRFRPELVLVSAGYDAHWRNVGYVQGIHERVTVAGFAALAARLQAIADTHCPGRLVGVLEGGYDLDSLALGVLATLRVWLGDDDVDDPLGPPPGDTPAPDLTELLARIKKRHGLTKSSSRE